MAPKVAPGSGWRALEAPTKQEDPDQVRNGLLHLSGQVVLVTFVCLQLASLVQPKVTVAGSFAFYLPGQLLAFGAMACARRGWTRLGGYMLLLYLWAAITLAGLFFGGLAEGANTAAYVAVVSLAAFVLGGRHALAFGALCLGSAAMVVAVELRGWLPEPVARLGPVESFTGLVAILGFSLSITLVLLKHLADVQRRLFEERQRLQAALRREEAHRADEERSAQRQSRLSTLARTLIVRRDDTWQDDIVTSLKELTGAHHVGFGVERDGGGFEILAGTIPPEHVDGLPLLAREARLNGTLVRDPKGSWNGSIEQGILTPLRGHHVQGLLWQLGGMTATADVTLASTVSSMIAGVLDREVAESLAERAQKMEIVGRLAGTIAHDFNNVLTTLVNSTDVARAEAAAGRSVVPYLDEIEQAGEHAVALISQLLAFTRQQPKGRTDVQLSSVVERIKPLLQRLAGNGRRMNVRLGHEGVRINVDVTQLEQVLLNLVVNARDATAMGGRIEVMVDGGGWDELGRAQPVRLSVSDDGQGMSEEVKRRAFDAFFTTKAQGTGLGLMTVRSIAEAHGGDVLVRSAPGQGCCIEMSFPPSPPAPGDRGATTVNTTFDVDQASPGPSKSVPPS